MQLLPLRPWTRVVSLFSIALAACQSQPNGATNATTDASAPRAVAAARGWSAPVYPDAPRENVVDQYHGVEVADPYRWLEDPDAPRTVAWVQAENAVTQAFLAPVAARERLTQRLTELWNYERYGVPYERNGRFFLSKNDGLQNQNVLYVSESIDGAPRVLLDPNTLSKDGTVALAGSSVSDDGRYLAYALADGGSDWNIWRVRDVDSGRDLEDELRWVKFSGASWLPDSSGFFYSRYDEPTGGQELRGVNYFQKLCFHRLGTAQSQDQLVYERPDQKNGRSADRSARTGAGW